MRPNRAGCRDSAIERLQLAAVTGLFRLAALFFPVSREIRISLTAWMVAWAGLPPPKGGFDRPTAPFPGCAEPGHPSAWTGHRCHRRAAAGGAGMDRRTRRD